MYDAKVGARAEKAGAGGRKHRSQIKERERPFWVLPSFYTSVSPVIFMLIGLIVTWSSGWFDAQQKKLDAQKIEVAYEVKKLEEKKHELQLQLQEKTSELTTISNSFELHRVEAKRQLEASTQEMSMLRTLIKQTENELSATKDDRQRYRRIAAAYKNQFRAKLAALKEREREILTHFLPTASISKDIRLQISEYESILNDLEGASASGLP